LAKTSRSPRFTPFSHLAILCTLLTASCISKADLNPADQANADAKGLFLESIEWGRLVDVYDINGNLVEEDVLVNHKITSSSEVKLIANAVTQRESLFIQFPKGSAEFDTRFFAYRDDLVPVERRDVNGELTYDMVARNAVVRLNFNLPVDPVSVDASSVQVFQGLSSSDTPQFSSIIVAKNGSSTNTAYLGSILIDPTVSRIDAAEEELPANVIGFGESLGSNDYNMVIHIPTEIDLVNGVSSVLSTLDGVYGPGRRDTSEPVKIIGLDNYMLLAAMRTGNRLDVDGGFMRDSIRPSLLGVQETTILSHAFNGSDIDVTYAVDALACRDLMPKIGDVFEVVDTNSDVNVWAVVAVPDSVPPFYSVRCVNSDYDSSLFAAVVPGTLSTRYSAVDSAIQACYLRIEPSPTTSLPVGGIPENARVEVRFDEPIDASTMRSTSTFVIIQPDDRLNPDPQDLKESQTAWYRQIDNSESVSDFIDRQRGYDYRTDTNGVATAEAEYGGRVLFGQVIAADSNRAFSITPAAGWKELNLGDGFDEYVVALRGGLDGIKDMAGNSVQLTSFVAGNNDQDIQLEIEHSALPPEETRYFSLLCNSLDEDSDGNVEWAGQVNQVDFNGQLTGRMPSRFTRPADNTQGSLSLHLVGDVANQGAVSDPLNFAGAVVMNVYRPEDFGFGYENVSEFNYTVEGFSWSPFGGVVYDENYNKISLSLSHSVTMPDEFYSTIPPAPIWPFSGMLTTSFNENVLGFTADGTSGIDEKTVFSSPYFPRDISKYQLGGIEYMPWPGFTDNFVWRDTSFDQAYLGGTDLSAGAPTDNYITILGEWDPAFGRRYGGGFIPTVALPLQCRFRTYPQMDAISLNTFSTSLMMSPANTPPKLPMFRIYSAGGQDLSGNWHRVQPDQAGQSGGIPVGGWRNGTATAESGDDLVYWAAVDFSLEVSRMHSHWFAVGGILGSGDIVGDVVVEPTAENQPTGTSLVIEYRGSQSVTANANPLENSTPLNDASVELGDSGLLPFDHYGDFVGGTGSVSTPSAWTTDIHDLEDNDYGFVQIRVSFMADPDTSSRPTLDGLGIAWTN
jgi:hypothetical protein